jgi:hypothetical protein
MYYLIPDDATEDETLQLAEEQRAVRRQPNPLVQLLRNVAADLQAAKQA